MEKNKLVSKLENWKKEGRRLILHMMDGKDLDGKIIKIDKFGFFLKHPKIEEAAYVKPVQVKAFTTYPLPGDVVEEEEPETKIIGTITDSGYKESA